MENPPSNIFAIFQTNNEMTVVAEDIDSLLQLSGPSTTVQSFG